jgi:hypothetical protein
MAAESKNVLKGKVIQERKGLFVQVGRDKIHLGNLMEESKAKEIVGKDVKVIFSDSTMRSAIGVKAEMARCYFILCYYPPPIWRVFKDDEWKVVSDVPIPIDKDLRIGIANRLLKENIIDKELHEQIIT